MRKYVMISLMIVVCLYASGCSNNVQQQSSSSEIVSQAETVSGDMSGDVSPAPSEDNQVYVDMLMPGLASLGETNDITNLVVDEPKALGNTDSKMQVVYFNAGDRYLQAALTITDGTMSLTSISDGNSALKYYYFPGANDVNELGVISVQLYDYDTDEPIEMDESATQSKSVAENQFEAIIDSYPFAEITEHNTEKESYTVAINLVTSNLDKTDLDAKSIAMMWLYQMQLLVADIVDSEKLESFPCDVIVFNILIDDVHIGVVPMYTTPESVLFGTSKPIVVDEQYKQSFVDMYDEYIKDTLDYSNYL